MKTALDRIIDYKHDEVANLKRTRSLSDLMRACAQQTPARDFAGALSAVVDDGSNALICEIKRKSPSAGEILPGADPLAIATDYEAAGAACLSILTDGPSFGGSLSDLAAVREKVSLPILRKDFMIDTIQVAEARAAGADAILVILSAVDDHLALDLCQAADEHGMDVIVETHDRLEIERANALPARLVGINNRDLKRMVTELETTISLAPLLSSDKQLISESGISSPAHIAHLRSSGARRFLIGESLMKSQQRQLDCINLRNTR